MSDKAFKLSISFLSVFAALVLIIGIFSSFPKPEKENLPASQSVNAFEPEEAAPLKIVDSTKAESFDSLLSVMTALKNRYPNLLGLYTSGYSENGRELLTLTLGTGPRKALVIGGIHAREHITTKYLLKVIEDYCIAFSSENGYFGAYNIKDLLSKYTLYIIPCVNPDGLEIIRSRQSITAGVRVSDLAEYKANANGVDLNRSFPLAWESISNGVTAPADYYFKGYSPASQAETKALMSLCLNVSFDFMLSIHIKGNCIFWGDTFKTENLGVYKAFANDIASPCGLYLPEPTEKPKDYGGGFENWFRHTFDRPGVCIELSKNENIVRPLTDENYKDFDAFVNYPLTANALAAAMASPNK